MNDAAGGDIRKVITDNRNWFNIMNIPTSVSHAAMIALYRGLGEFIATCNDAGQVQEARKVLDLVKSKGRRFSGE